MTCRPSTSTLPATNRSAPRLPSSPGPRPDRHVPPAERPGDPATTAATAEPLGPDSLLWRLGLPRTSVLLAGRALLLQVAHPTVGAGVRDFSDFRSDPWGRFERTVTSLLTQLFGGQLAAAEARQLRERHRSITGTGFDGHPYRATEPDAWAWVHLANGDTMLTFHQLLGRPLDNAQQERYWADWCQAGRVLGIRPAQLPADVDALRARVDETVATTLGDNETVRLVLATIVLEQVGPPPLLPGPLWDLLRPLGRPLLLDATVGTLPPALRATLGLAWTDGAQHRLDRLAALVRSASAGIPDRALHYPAAYRAVRAARRYDGAGGRGG